MKTPILHSPLALTLTFTLCLTPLAQAQIIVSHWNFNSFPPDTKTTTGSLLPSVGAGTVSVVGGVTSTFSDATGSKDPAKKDNTGLNLSTFASQGKGDGTRGVQFQVPTVGYENVVVSWDQRFSSTASKAYQFQYSLDGVQFLPFSTLLNTAGGNAWMTGNTVDLGGVPGAADNPDFAFRILSVFSPGTSAYGASGVGSSYSTSGTWRFDEMTVQGSAIPAAVPEPGAYALLAAGGLIGFAFWRRNRTRGSAADRAANG